MKNILFAISVLIALLLSVGLNAQKAECDKSKSEKNKTECTTDKSETVLKVDGKCGMCKSKIETAALSVEGVSKADYDLESHELKLNHDKDACMKTVQKTISAVGYDTGDYKASAEAYASLPACCHYRE